MLAHSNEADTDGAADGPVVSRTGEQKEQQGRWSEARLLPPLPHSPPTGGEPQQLIQWQCLLRETGKIFSERCPQRTEWMKASVQPPQQVRFEK